MNTSQVQEGGMVHYCIAFTISIRLGHCREDALFFNVVCVSTLLVTVPNTPSTCFTFSLLSFAVSRRWHTYTVDFNLIPSSFCRRFASRAVLVSLPTSSRIRYHTNTTHTRPSLSRVPDFAVVDSAALSSFLSTKSSCHYTSAPSAALTQRQSTLDRRFRCQPRYSSTSATSRRRLHFEDKSLLPAVWGINLARANDRELPRISQGCHESEGTVGRGATSHDMV